MSQWIGRTLNDYRILTLVRATALDAVYRAYDNKLDRVVALQIWLPDTALPEGLAEKLRIYTNTLSHLSHPNIGPLLDCGVCDGALFLAYDFAPTRALRRRFHQAQTWQQATQVLAPVAQALAYAHRMGIVHGSLRPEQILLREDGSPVLFDFGIELLIEQELRRAMPESVLLGSLLTSFLAPERALNQRVGPGADLYSLGMILFEWMAGQRAYTGETFFSELLSRDQDPHKPVEARALTRKARLRRQKEKQVAARILTRLLQSDPLKRETDTQHVANLLAKAALQQAIPRRLVDNPQWQPFRMRWGHWAGLAGLLCAGLLVWLGSSIRNDPGLLNEAARSLGIAIATATPEPVGMVPSPSPTLAPGEVAAPTATPTNPPAPRPTTPFTATPVPTITPIDPASLPYQQQTPLPVVAEKITGLNADALQNLGRWGLGISNAIAFSPDGSQLGMATTTGVYLFQIPGFAPAGYLNTSGSVSALTFVSGQLLATGDSTGLVRIWEFGAGRMKFPLPGHQSPVVHLATSKDQQRLASSDGKSIFLWDIENGKQIASLKGHTNTVNGLAFSPDNKLLASVSSDQTVRLWDAADGNLISTYTYPARVKAVAFAPSGGRFYTAGDDRKIQAWQVDNKSPDLFADTKQSWSRLAWSADGQHLIASAEDGALSVFDAAGRPLWASKLESKLGRLAGQTAYPYDAAARPGTGSLAAMLWDNTVAFYNLADGSLAETGALPGYSDFYSNLAISPNSRILLAEMVNGNVKVWDLPSAQVLFSVPGKLLKGRTFSPASDRFAVQSGKGEVSVYALDSQKLFTFGGHPNLVGATFSKDGLLLLTGDLNQMRVWSLVSGLELRTRTGGLEGCSALLSPPEQGSRLIAFANRYNFLDFSDYGKEKICSLVAPVYANSSLLEINLDGRLAAAPVNNRATVWDYDLNPIEKIAEESNNAVLMAAPTGDSSPGQIVKLALNEEGKILAAVFSDTYLRIWDTSLSSAPLTERDAHGGVPTALAISPDGRFLVTAALDGTLRIWGVIP